MSEDNWNGPEGTEDSDRGAARSCKLGTVSLSRGTVGFARGRLGERVWRPLTGAGFGVSPVGSDDQQA